MAARTGALLPLFILRASPSLLGFAREFAATAGANLAQDVGGNRGGQVFGESAHIRREMVNRDGLALSLGQFCGPRHPPTLAARIWAQNSTYAR